MKVYHLLQVDPDGEWDTCGIFSSIQKALDYKNKYQRQHDLYEFELDREGDPGEVVPLVAVEYKCRLTAQNKKTIEITAPTFQEMEKKLNYIGKDLGTGISYWRYIHINGVDYQGAIRESKWRLDENN